MRAFIVSVLLSSFSACGALAHDNTLIGGRVVDLGEYPEVIRIKQCSGTRCAYCSASLVGPKTVLTAAHCTTEKGEIIPVSEKHNYEFEVNQASYKAKCYQAPSYGDSDRTDNLDMALCVTDQPVAVKYASLSEKGPQVNEIVTLIGYGCTVPRNPDGSGGGSGGNDGKLRVGEAPVYKLPAGKDNWYYTRASTALCSGDSGGPSFQRITDPKKEHHYVMGVNSMGDLRQVSLMTAVYIPKALEFIEKFAQEHQAEICGFNKDCDGEEPKPEPEKCKSELEGLQRARLLLDQAVDKVQACMVK